MIILWNVLEPLCISVCPRTTGEKLLGRNTIVICLEIYARDCRWREAWTSRSEKLIFTQSFCLKTESEVPQRKLTTLESVSWTFGKVKLFYNSTLKSPSSITGLRFIARAWIGIVSSLKSLHSSLFYRSRYIRSKTVCHILRIFWITTLIGPWNLPLS